MTKQMVTVTINGGATNPWAQYGLRVNPFPQLAKHEFMTANAMLAQLDSEPITSIDEIKRILEGCDRQFVDLCCAQYRPGKRIKFQVFWYE